MAGIPRMAADCEGWTTVRRVHTLRRSSQGEWTEVHACPRCAGPGCCAACRAAGKGPASRPCGAAIPHAGSPACSTPLACSMSPDCGLTALPVRSPMLRSRLRLHRKAEQPECGEMAGAAGRLTTAARSRARGSRAPASFTLRVNDEPAGRTDHRSAHAAALRALHAGQIAPPGHPPRPMPGR
jgi:hypothetical protein